MIEQGNSPYSDYRENLIIHVANTIEDESFKNRSRTAECGGKGFSRNRKLTFIHLIVLLTQGVFRSLQREINSFYQRLQAGEFSLQYVDKSAFSRARSKLKPEAFKELAQVSNDSFYRDAPYRSWRDYRLLAIDGSTVRLPKHPSIEQEFGTANFGPDAAVPRSVARISMLYDVLNFTTLDAQIDGYDSSERELARRHLQQVKAGTDLLLMDRGYPGLRMMYELQLAGIDYCMRMRLEWWLEVRQMLAEGQTDKEVVFELPAKDRDTLSPMEDGSYRMRCRLVAVALPNQEVEVLCTSVCDREKIPYEQFAELYHYRWNIEEGFKLYKTRLQLEAFSGKTALAVKQDFFAKVFMMTLTAALAFPVDEKIKEEQAATTRKHPYKVNKTNALSGTREAISHFFIKRVIKPSLAAIDSLLKATVDIIRPGRRYPRRKIKKKPPSQSYKQL